MVYMNSCHVFRHLAHASETRTRIYFRYCFVSYTIDVFRGTMFTKKNSCFLSQDIDIRYWLHFWAYLFRVHELNVHCVFHRAGVFNTFCVSGCQTASGHLELAHVFISDMLHELYHKRVSWNNVYTKNSRFYHMILASVIGCTSGRICFAYMN